jgi:hypothetical protein
MPDYAMPDTLYVQYDGRSALVANSTPDKALQQRIENAGKRVGVYKLEKLVSIAVQPVITDLPPEPAATGSAPATPPPITQP